MSNTPIDQHALLSDCGAAALVTSEGSVDWLCLPRFDSAPVLGRLLDDGAGHFCIAPVGAAQTTSRRYRPSSLVLDTTWESPEGTVVLTEAMALGRHDRGHELGRSAPRVLLRMIRCTPRCGDDEHRVRPAPRVRVGAPPAERRDRCRPRPRRVDDRGAQHRAGHGHRPGHRLRRGDRDGGAGAGFRAGAVRCVGSAAAGVERAGDPPLVSPPPRRPGGAGRSCTSATRARTGSWSITAGWSCRP